MFIPAKSTLFAFGSVFAITAGALAGGSIVKHESTDYQSVADSPLFNPGCDRVGVEFYLENFEDGLLNTPNIATPGEPFSVASPGANTDSVDNNGRSLFASAATITLTFVDVEGQLPTRAGVVISDTAITANAPFTFFVMSGEGEPGIFNVNIGDNSPVASTGDDRFVGFSCPDGIAYIQISAPIANFELDHLQYERVSASPLAATTRGDGDGSGTGDVYFHVPGGAVTAWYLADLNQSPLEIEDVMSSSWTIQGFGDVDGDCDDDIIWRNSSSSSKVQVWTMEQGVVIDKTNISTNLPSTWAITGIGDFDGNGTADIFMERDSTKSMQIWFLNGDSIASTAAVTSPNFDPSLFSVHSVGDINLDGMADIVWRKTSSGDLRYFKMSGATVLKNGMIQAGLNTDWVAMGGGDLNGDGTLDLGWRSAANGNVLLALVGTDFKVSTSAQLSLASGFTFVGFPDVNGDGMADVVWRKTSDGKIVRWKMNGLTVLNSATIGTGPTTSGLKTHAEK